MPVEALPLVFVETIEGAAAGEGEDVVLVLPVVDLLVADVVGFAFPLGCCCCSWSKLKSAAACEMPRSCGEGGGVPEIQDFFFWVFGCVTLSQEDQCRLLKNRGQILA